MITDLLVSSLLIVGAAAQDDEMPVAQFKLDGKLYTVLWTNNTESLAVLQKGGRLRLISPISGSDKVEIPATSIHQDACSLAQFGQMIVAVGPTQTDLLGWNSTTGHRELRIEGFKSTPFAIACCPRRESLAATCVDGSVFHWTKTDGKLKKLGRHDDIAGGLTFSPDGKRLATVSHDCTVKIWNLADGICSTLKGHDANLLRVVYISNGERVATCGHDSRICVWNLRTGLIERTLDGQNDTVWSLATCCEGRMLASAGSNGQIQIWNCKTAQCLAVLEHPGCIRSIAISPCGMKLASVADDSRVRIWNIKKYAEQLGK